MFKRVFKRWEEAKPKAIELYGKIPQSPAHFDDDFFSEINNNINYKWLPNILTEIKIPAPTNEEYRLFIKFPEEAQC